MANEYFKIRSKMIIILDTTQDISTAELVAVIAKRPDGTVKRYTGEIYMTNKIRAVIPAADNTAAGTWLFDGFIDFGSGGEHYVGTSSESIQPLLSAA